MIKEAEENSFDLYSQNYNEFEFDSEESDIKGAEESEDGLEVGDSEIQDHQPRQRRACICSDSITKCG